MLIVLKIVIFLLMFFLFLYALKNLVVFSGKFFSKGQGLRELLIAMSCFLIFIGMLMYIKANPEQFDMKIIEAQSDKVESNNN